MGGICPAGDLPLKADSALKGIRPLRRFASISAPSPGRVPVGVGGWKRPPRGNTPGTFVMGRIPYCTRGEPPRAKLGCSPGLTRPLAAPRPAPSRPPPREENRAFRPPPGSRCRQVKPRQVKPREGKQASRPPRPFPPRSWPFPGPFPARSRSPPSPCPSRPCAPANGHEKGGRFRDPLALPRSTRQGGPDCP